MINLEAIWQSLLSFLEAHLPYVSPFWGWLLEGSMVIAICVVLGWAFATLRPYAGVVILVIVAALTGYRRGEKDQSRHDRRR
jgi:hypothetical protein